MAVAPEQYFRFAADHIPLLRELYYRPDGVGEGELRQLIARERRTDQPASGYLFRQLLEFELVEEMPGQTAFLELTAPWKDILGHLFREQRLTNIAVIQAYLNELERVSVELSGAVHQQQGAHCVVLLDEARALVERLRRDSRDNRLGIIAEAIKSKSGTDELAAVDRYDRIIRLWERYVEPLRDIVDSHKEMDERLRVLEELANEGRVQFRADAIMEREFAAMRSRVLRLLRDAMEDYRESVRELEPLYNEALRGSRYLRGAAQALDGLTRRGLKSLKLTQRLALPVWRLMNVLSDDHVEAYLYQIRDYRPSAPPAVGEAGDAELPTVIPFQDIRSALRSCLPLQDTLGWLQQQYPTMRLHQVLNVYGRIFGDRTLLRSYGENRLYRFGSVNVRAHVVKLEMNDG